MSPAPFKPGDKVTYFGVPKNDNGIVKTIDGDRIFVVYDWNDDEKNYANYTAQLTPRHKLGKGWDAKYIEQYHVQVGEVDLKIMPSTDNDSETEDT